MSELPPVLLAEDNDDDAFFMQHAFRRSQVPNPLVRVPDGQKALRYLCGEEAYADRVQHPTPCLLLLDLKMPTMDGFEVLTWLQEHPDLRDRVPIVVLSASAQQADQARALALGAREYLVKPSEFVELKALVQGLKARWLGCGAEPLPTPERS